MANPITSRDLIKRLFSATELPRIPFIPWVCTHAARLEQVSVRQMLTDSTKLAMSLQNTQKLYGYDVVANVFDSSLEVEACGCSITWKSEQELPFVSGHPVGGSIAQLDIANIEKRGRLPVVLEATRRLKIVLGKTVALAGVVTGPVSLAARLREDNIIQKLDETPEEAREILELARQICLKICRAYCELGVDIIAVADDLLPQALPKHLPLLLSVFRPLWSMARFYDAQSILLTRGCTGDNVEALLQLGADGVVVGRIPG